MKDDAKIVLLILQSIGKLPFNISIGEAKAIKRLSENVGELFNGDGIKRGDNIAWSNYYNSH